jgi:deoxycytidine triphosphate deaminase
MYSDTDILDAMQRRDIKISPFEASQLQINSYDLCLGNTFYEVFWDAEGPFFAGPYVYLEGDEVNIPAGGTLLGMSRERIGTSGKVVAGLHSVSSTRRVGITTNCDAGSGDVGYNDYWTLELAAFVREYKMVQFNLSTLEPEKSDSLPFLTVGQRVAQMVFYECKSKPISEYNGQYQVDWPLNMIPKKYRHRIRSIK